jgi:hypothetical protein
VPTPTIGQPTIGQSTIGQSTIGKPREAEAETVPDAAAQRWFRRPFAVGRGRFARRPKKAGQPVPVPVPAHAPVEQPYIAYDHDPTFDPYDFLPVDVPSEPVPTPWYDDASREARWAALREASTPPEPEPSEHSDEPQPPDMKGTN